MKWIVLWTVISSFLVPCKSPDPIEDQFGRIPQFTSTYDLACYNTTETKKSKEFYNYEEAIRFIEEGKKQSDLRDWKLYENKSNLK